MRAPSQLVAELAGLRRLTANLASNINQIARVLNSGGSPAPSILAAADAVRRTMTRLDSALAVLGSGPPSRPPARSAGPPAQPGSSPAIRGSFGPTCRAERIIPEAPA